MTRSKRSPSAKQPPPASDAPAPVAAPDRASLRTAAALLWLMGAVGLFFSVAPLHHPQFPRIDFLQQSPELLADVLDPTPDPSQPPQAFAHLAQRTDLVLLAALVWTAAWALGALLLRVVRPTWTRDDRLLRHAFAAALGIAAWSLFVLGAGLAGLLVRPLFVAAIVLTIGAEVGLTLRDRRRTRAAHPNDAIRPTDAPVPDRATRFCLAGGVLVATPFLAAILLGACLPSVDFDVNEYHLQGPKEWHLAGSIRFLPHNLYTSFPFLTEMLSLLGMTLHGDWFHGALVGKVVLSGFAPLTALLLFDQARKWSGTPAGVVAGVAYLATPWVVRWSTIAYVEGGLACFGCATFVAVVRRIEAARRNEAVRGADVLLCGLFAGCALACKYPALVSVVVPSFVVVLGTTRARRAETDGAGGPLPAGRGSWKTAAVFVAGVALAAGPWLAKNLAQTGNPVYPLARSVFGGPERDAGLEARWAAAHRPPNFAPTDLGQRAVEVGLTSDWLNPLVFALAPIALWCGPVEQRRRARGTALAIAFVFVQWWLLTHRIDRFFLPALPLGCLLAGCAASVLASRRTVVALLVAGAVGLPYDLAVSTSRLTGWNAYLADLDAARPWASRFNNPGLFELGERLPAGSKVLLEGDAMVFDATYPLAYHTVFDRCLLEEYATEPAAPGGSGAERTWRAAEAIRARLAADGITHVGVSWQEVGRYRATYGFSSFVVPESFARLERLGVLGPAELRAEFAPGLLDEHELRALHATLPRTERLPDGRTVRIVGLRTPPSPEQRAALDRWAPGLIVPWRTGELVVTHQLHACRKAGGKE